MTRTFADDIYDAAKGYNKFTDDPQTNRKLLNELVSEINITKSSLRELDIDNPGASFHLQYLLQEDGVNFGLCPFYKEWYNRHGRQSRCRFNEGPVQVYCGAEHAKCAHPSEYGAHIENPESVLMPRR